ncbi:sigma 54-interacting transcriptional regulator [Desulfogranum marinum]|uniref:sigma 54-interacting transcriptional regulator n=1 Tax=Desulfogranum marinum TaxID=453220 RepID=UPI0029C84849|nr:sigma 54-interacting transcriptional regulator [Desulfogranum marinum]
MTLRTKNDQDTACEANCGFEKLLMQVSALFVNLPLDSIDAVIEDTQKRICKYLDIDLSALWQWSDKDTHIMTLTHLYSPEEGPTRPIDIDACVSFPWVYGKMLERETLAISNDDLPEEASIDKTTRQGLGVVSSVVLPLATGDTPVLGVISFDLLSRRRFWTDYEVKRLKLVAEIFANVLVRKNAEKKLIESEARLSLAAESAGHGMWELDYQKGSFWATKQARKLFDYSPDENVTMDLFEQSIVDEDLEKVRAALTASLAENHKLQVEYRILDKKGRAKWIVSKGRPFYHADGTPSRMLGISVDISDRKQLEEALHQKLAEVEQLKQQIEQENLYLREDLQTEKGFEQIVGSSKQFKSVLASCKQVAPTAATVLLLGETGTGKGVMANAIHKMSDRKQQPFVTVNCAALPHNLIESELFGRDKGAFTGAHAAQAGRFQVANHGTLFLDEIGEMPLEMQAKLLRVLQDGEFERLGSPVTVKVDVRVIAATGRDLKKDVQDGRFREDLFYRLNVFPITIPSLRERIEDVLPLTQFFIEKYSRKMGKQIDKLPTKALNLLRAYAWPGNVRELQHLIERCAIITTGNSLCINKQLINIDCDSALDKKLKDIKTIEREHIVKVLHATDWKIEGANGAAAVLDLHPSTLRFRLKKLSIKRPV